jgi:hypothetical protein
MERDRRPAPTQCGECRTLGGRRHLGPLANHEIRPTLWQPEMWAGCCAHPAWRRAGERESRENACSYRGRADRRLHASPRFARGQSRRNPQRRRNFPIRPRPSRCLVASDCLESGAICPAKPSFFTLRIIWQNFLHAFWHIRAHSMSPDYKAFARGPNRALPYSLQ